MIDAWNALAAEYRALAPTPELKALSIKLMTHCAR
jgi:hypothetical protein